jgi:adenine phosphoribosyltransferase
MSYPAIQNQPHRSSTLTLEGVRAAIRDIPDYPKPGILFKDITTVLQDGPLFAFVVDELVRRAQAYKPDYIAGIEARGFLFGAPLAQRLGLGFIPIRKKGKLPGATWQQTYSLEYGEDTVEIHQGCVEPGARILIIDDLLATGGTAKASLSLFQQAEAVVVGSLFVIELAFLKGRSVLSEQAPVEALLAFD